MVTRMTIPYEEMTKEQKFATFEAWEQKVSKRKKDTKAKRSAQKIILGKYKTEYEGLIKSETVRLGSQANEPADEDDDDTPVAGAGTSAGAVARGRK